MKVVILAGGFGTRFSEETKRIPKPMSEIGGDNAVKSFRKKTFLTEPR